MKQSTCNECGLPVERNAIGSLGNWHHLDGSRSGHKAWPIDIPDNGWRFNRKYDDYEQVISFVPAYDAICNEITSSGKYPYDDSFRGRIPQLSGPDEESAIYLLQCYRRQRELDAKIARYLADGFSFFTDPAPNAPKRFSTIVHIGGSVGWQEWHEARLTRFYSTGRLAVLPKGKRTRGFMITGKVMVKK